MEHMTPGLRDAMTVKEWTEMTKPKHLIEHKQSLMICIVCSWTSER